MKAICQNCDGLMEDRDSGEPDCIDGWWCDFCMEWFSQDELTSITYELSNGEAINLTAIHKASCPFCGSDCCIVPTNTGWKCMFCSGDIEADQYLLIHNSPANEYFMELPDQDAISSDKPSSQE